MVLIFFGTNVETTATGGKSFGIYFDFV